MPKRGDQFPHVDINVEDQSRRPTPPATPAGLHQPIYFIFAERGPVNKPVRGNYAYLTEVFGTMTFDTKSKYFFHPTFFALGAAQYQDIWVVRLASDTAAKSSLLLYAEVIDKDIPLYQKDETTGARITDEDGDWVQEDEAPTTVDGVELTWKVRVIDYAGDETLTNLEPSSQVVDDDTVWTYPIMAFEADDVGSAGNNLGFKFWYTSGFTDSVVENTNAMTYRFSPVRLNTQSDNVVAIHDIYNQPQSEVSLLADAYDKDTSLYYDADEVLSRRYLVTDGDEPFNSLGMKTHVYTANVVTICNLIAGKDAGIDAEDAQKINIFTGVDADGFYYDYLAVNGASTYLNANQVNYLLGGSDGTQTLSELESLTVDYLGGDVYPAIADKARYPISHVYDSGYAATAKTAMINFLGIRDDVFVSMASQDVSKDPFTEAADISSGQSLRAQLLLHPESTFFGTPVLRGAVYCQVGDAVGYPSYKTKVPVLYDRMIKRCISDGGQILGAEPTGVPAAEITALSNISWAPVTDTVLRNAWASGLNVARYHDTDSLFFPDYITAHPFDNSVLSSELFADKIVYIKRMTWLTWTETVGSTENKSRLHAKIAESLNGRIHRRLAGSIQAEARAYQTAEDEALGYRSTVKVSIFGSIPNRVLDVIIQVDRQSAE
jgi:hypothetical protein